MNELSSEDRIESIRTRLKPLLQELQAHPVYASIETVDHLRVFLQSHVFAVWDFMSLLKTLQRPLTCVEVPWVPMGSAKSRRFINEIVLGEESDEYKGRAVSHFELYLEAMEQVEADTSVIRRFLSTAGGGVGGLDYDGVPDAARTFVQTTFGVIERGSTAAQAAVFAFGREDAIPEMFRSLVRQLNRDGGGDLGLLIWYLERHIEVDGEDHGPLALGMVADLCGDDAAVWEEATVAAENAIRPRIGLWDGVAAEIRANAESADTIKTEDVAGSSGLV